MSSDQATSIETKTKIKLAEISAKIDQLVAEECKDLSFEELNHILENYEKYLKYDLKRNLQEMREKNLKESPFDAIINDDLGIK
jgi:glutamate synthase domain-containing protein 3|tara:strand:+ start:75 stop:326 length:252 start_codon:yes stop_codon:yes gene_type:complete